MSLLQIYFRFIGEDFKGTALPVIEENRRVRYIVNIPGLRKDITLISEGYENAGLSWRDYDTE